MDVKQKGAKGELQVRDLLQDVLDKVAADIGVPAPVLQRNVLQSQEGGSDLRGLPWLACEVKRVENLSGLPSWWRQCMNAAKPGQLPVLIYRQNFGPWNVRTYLPIKVGPIVVRMTMNLSWLDFRVYFEQRARFELSKADP
jgi:hypothetical protein